MIMERYCQQCGRERQPREYVCPGRTLRGDEEVECGSTFYGPHIPIGCSPSEEEVPVAGPLAGKLSLPWGKVALLYGGPGAGKTTVALKTLPGATILTSEMSPTLVASYCARLGVKRGPIYEPRVRDDGSVELGIPRDHVPRELIFDSLAETASDTSPLDALMAWCEAHRARAIAITQVTADGKPRGGPRIAHKPHQRIRVGVDSMGNSALIVEKNRSGELFSVTFDLKNGEKKPIEVYCSVEGTYPDFWLAPHPDPKAKRADVLWAVEAGEFKGLPAHPVAVGAKKSRLYPEGWVELPGVEHRRTFAESQGVEYFSPMG